MAENDLSTSERIESPIFVGGTGRSGTWAVGRLVGQHETITAVFTELRFHAVPKGFRAVLSGEMTPDEYADSILEKWYQPPGGTRAKGLQLLVSQPVVMEAAERFRGRAVSDLAEALAHLMRELIDPWAREQGTERWTETTPDNAAAAGALTTVFPGGRVIHMVRDGRDAAASVARVGWGPDTIEDGLEWWGRRMEAAQLGVAMAPPDRVLTLRLEDLVHFDRSHCFAALTAFLGIDQSAPMVDFFEQRLNSDLGHFGRWRADVSPQVRDHIDGRYRELLDELAEVGTPCPPIDPGRIDELADSRESG